MNLYLRVSVNGVLSDPIDRYAPTVSLELDYPGGDVPWEVQTQTVSFVAANSTNFGFENLTVVLKFLKR